MLSRRGLVRVSLWAAAEKLSRRMRSDCSVSRGWAAVAAEELAGVLLLQRHLSRPP